MGKDFGAMVKVEVLDLFGSKETFSDLDQTLTRSSSGVRGQWVRPDLIRVESDDVINTNLSPKFKILIVTSAYVKKKCH